MFKSEVHILYYYMYITQISVAAEIVQVAITSCIYFISLTLNLLQMFVWRQEGVQKSKCGCNYEAFWDTINQNSNAEMIWKQTPESKIIHQKRKVGTGDLSTEIQATGISSEAKKENICLLLTNLGTEPPGCGSWHHHLLPVQLWKICFPL